MSDEIKAVRKAIESCREYGKERSGATCLFSEAGPLSIGVVEKILAAIESLDKRLTELER